MSVRHGLLKNLIHHLGERKRKEVEEKISEEKPRVSVLSEEAEKNIRSMARELGPRPSGSEESRRASAFIRSKFEELGLSAVESEVKIIRKLWANYAVLATVTAIAASFLTLISLPYLSIVAIFLYIFLLFNSRGTLKKMFHSTQGSNVHAIIEPRDEIRNTIIFSSHHDSAEIGKEGKKYVWAALSVVLSSLFSLFETIKEIFTHSLIRPGLPTSKMFFFFLIVVFVSTFSLYVLKKKKDVVFSLGSGDNLSGVCTVLSLAKYFSKAGRLKTTALVFASFDGEECGAQGSKEWFEWAERELINPVNINIDGLYDEENLAFLITDGNGFQRLSDYVCSKCSRIADVLGYEITMGKLGFFGGMTDAASAARCGIDATTITAMAPGVKTAAHTEEDTPDKVSREALYRVLSISIKFAEVIDKEAEREREGGEALISGKGKYTLY